jgi:hypothetical protein
VFDIREEPSKPRECIIIWNPEIAVRLPVLSIWDFLTIQSFSIHPLSTTLNLTLNRNLSAQPAVKRKSPDEAPPAPAPKKKSRPSDLPPPPPARPSKGGKTLPSVGRKSLPASIVKTAPTGGGKYKSSEIIESDEDEEMEGEGEGDEEDDFATMLGAEMAQPDVGAGDDDEEDDDEEEEESDDELGGAKLVADAHTEWI